jgi:hypothetical protein
MKPLSLTLLLLFAQFSFALRSESNTVSARSIPAVPFAATVLDFENLPAGTTVIEQYVSRGVRFPAAFLGPDPAARSGNRVLRTAPPNSDIFMPIPLRMDFTTAQARVKLFAASADVTRSGIFKAFDANGAVIISDGPRLVTAGKYTTVFEISLAAPLIRRAELHLTDGWDFGIDDLEFDTAPSSQAAPTSVTETRQPATKSHAAVSGKFPDEFVIRPRIEPTEEEEFPVEPIPPVERELAPGKSAEVVTRVAGPTGLVGSVRWIGTAQPLEVTWSLNGSQKGSGKAYSTGPKRGAADVLGVADAAGEVKLSVKNTSNVPVKVRLDLGIAKGPAH